MSSVFPTSLSRPLAPNDLGLGGRRGFPTIFQREPRRENSKITVRARECPACAKHPVRRSAMLSAVALFSTY